MTSRSSINSSLLKVIERIATNLRTIRRAKGLTQAAIAELLDADLRWYQRLESGTHVFSLETLTRLSKIFKVDVSVFFKL